MAVDQKIYSVPSWLMCGSCGHVMLTEGAKQVGVIRSAECVNVACTEHGIKYDVELTQVKAVKREGE